MGRCGTGQIDTAGIALEYLYCIRKIYGMKRDVPLNSLSEQHVGTRKKVLMGSVCTGTIEMEHLGTIQ